MQTFSNIKDVISNIEKSIKKDCTASKQWDDDNHCVVKAIAVATHTDYDTAELLCRKYFNREFRKGVLSIRIINGISALLDDVGHKLIGMYNMHNYDAYGQVSTWKAPLTEKHNYDLPLLTLSYYRRKNLTVEQVRAQSKKRTFIVLVKGHALVVRDKQIIDYQEAKKRQVRFVFEII